MGKAAAQLVRQKLLLMGRQIEFLEYVWNSLTKEQQDTFINDYEGELPRKYNQ